MPASGARPRPPGGSRHPNIVGVYDYGENAETAWIVMELVEGGSLKDRLDQQRALHHPARSCGSWSEILAAPGLFATRAAWCTGTSSPATSC